MGCQAGGRRRRLLPKIDLGHQGMAGKFTQNVVAIIEGSDPV
ncbi:MAG: hypothetical protein U0S12_12340 [Fimbriimonadales bacterium]